MIEVFENGRDKCNVLFLYSQSFYNGPMRRVCSVSPWKPFGYLYSSFHNVRGK